MAKHKLLFVLETNRAVKDEWLGELEDALCSGASDILCDLRDGDSGEVEVRYQQVLECDLCPDVFIQQRAYDRHMQGIHGS